MFGRPTARYPHRDAESLLGGFKRMLLGGCNPPGKNQVNKFRNITSSTSSFLFGLWWFNPQKMSIMSHGDHAQCGSAHPTKLDLCKFRSMAQGKPTGLQRKDGPTAVAHVHRPTQRCSIQGERARGERVQVTWRLRGFFEHNTWAGSWNLEMTSFNPWISLESSPG